jgi:hypothetical protein
MLMKLGEKVYEENKERLEKESLGKIAAIEIESKKIAGIGDTVDDAYKIAVKKFVGKKFYFRKIGDERAAGYLF